MTEDVEKGPYPPFDRLRASGLDRPSMSARGEPFISAHGELVEPGAEHQSASAGMIAALVPVKALRHSKSRLRPMLSDGQREALVLAMLEDILRLLAGVPAIAATAVVSPDADVLAFARGLGAQPIQEPPRTRGLNAALAFASDVLSREGASGLLVLPADVPLATAADIETILNGIDTNPSIVLCPSRSGGTNALALRPPGTIPFRFGHRSSATHEREARARGLTLTLLPLPRLAFDIDRPQDLAAVLAEPIGTTTREVLASLPLNPLILSPSKDEQTPPHGSTGSP
jgi:2-phospho-L-lactate guanylyltransferase